MNAALATVSVAALALLAAAGVVAGFRRRDPIPVEPLGDALDDRRLALQRSLEDLEAARDGGALDEDAFSRLREDTRRRLDRVDAAIASRRAREAGIAVEAPPRPTGTVPSWAVGVLLVAVVGAVVLSALARETSMPQRPTVVADDRDPFAFFEARVREHPNDVAARLDLGRRYLDGGRLDEALEQYVAALELDPDGAEAHAQIGLILLIGERPEEALAEVDTALATAPDYPEALFYRGVILLEGLDRAAEAIGAFERYLEVAPFGAQRDRAEALIAEAEAALDQA